MTDNVKENHDRMKQLVDQCQLNTISHDEMTWTGDRKVLIVLELGITNPPTPVVFARPRLHSLARRELS